VQIINPPHGFHVADFPKIPLSGSVRTKQLGKMLRRIKVGEAIDQLFSGTIYLDNRYGLKHSTYLADNKT